MRIRDDIEPLFIPGVHMGCSVNEDGCVLKIKEIQTISSYIAYLKGFIGHSYT